jgi:hypothetical protein
MLYKGKKYYLKLSILFKSNLDMEGKFYFQEDKICFFVGKCYTGNGGMDAKCGEMYASS